MSSQLRTACPRTLVLSIALSIVSVSLTALLAHPLAAEGAGWTLLGPEGAMVREIEMDPSSDTLYAATWGDLYRSTDGGTTWSPLGIHEGVASVEIDPSGSPIYAGTDGGKLATSTDGGTTWSFRTTPDPFGLDAPPIVRLDPAHPLTLYATFVASSGFPGGIPGILKSIDGGASWAGADTGIESFPLLSMTLDPQNPAVLYLGSQGTVLKSIDGASSWSVLGAGQLPLNRNVSSLAVDPADSDRIYAGLDIGGIYRSDDGGTTWTAKTTGLTGFDTRAFTFDPADSSIVYSADSVGVFRSVDHGDAWSASGDGLFELGMDTLFIDPSDGDHLLTGGAVGVFRSVDAATSWSSSSQGLAHRSVLDLFVDRLAPATVYASTQSDALHRSLDAGQTWPILLVDGATSRAPTAIASAPSAPSTLYLGFDFGEVFRSIDGGSSWTSLPVFIDSVRSFSTITGLAVHPQDPMNLYAGLSSSPRLIHSLDGGTTWSPANQGLDLGPVSVLGIDPKDPSFLYAAQSRMFRSTDGGSSWSPVSAGLPTFPFVANDLDIDSSDPPTVYLSIQGGLFRSTDRAATWQPIDDGLPVSSVNVLLLDPDQPGVLYAAPAVNGVFRSPDRGATWSPLNDGFPVSSQSVTQAPDVRALALGSSAPQRKLYAGAFTTLALSGVYGLSIPFPSLFTDGFESGDLSAWTADVPP